MPKNHSESSFRPLALAVDVGGTKVEAALVDDEARVVPGTRHRAATGASNTAEGIADAVRRVIDETLASAPDGAPLVGAGVGSAGPISIERGTVSPLNLAAWRDFPLADLVRERSGVETVLRLDGLCILLAEHWAGSLQGYRTAMGMVVSTGIGGGLLVEGRLVGGRTGNAGHVGQIQLHTHEAEGKDLSVTLEGIAAGPRIVEWAQQQGWAGQTGEQLAASYRDGDPVAIAAVRRCARAIGEGIASVCALVDLEAVAIGGGFSRVTPDLFDLIRETVTDVAPLDTIPGVAIVPSALSDEGPLIGAAGLIHRAALLP
ncbi:ROK family protein [Herbiconiux daphne]|uniref:ROK family protein n=1 Tax=Herbiconiux daphne TaxID=2970914 RepID=A0ABT2H8H4_9MICO|nr:ROK family protein [Herbiconiux daphne]MCS5736222.1 ROK family protein [Herbiconiux daphne]